MLITLCATANGPLMANASNVRFGTEQVISVVLRPPLQLRFKLLGKPPDKC